MFFFYKRGITAAKIARDLRVTATFPYDHHTVNRPVRMTHQINWGCARAEFGEVPVLNRDITVAASKRATFQAFARYAAEGYGTIPHPRWTDQRDLVADVLQGCAVLGRRDGLSAGRGIVEYAADAETAIHDFYVERLPFRREYRVHVFCGAVIVMQQKQVPEGHTGVAHNFESGCVFVSGDTVGLRAGRVVRLKELAVAAVTAVGIDFGAVDVLMTPSKDFYVLEVNTAPGIRADSVYAAYVTAFRDFIVQ